MNSFETSRTPCGALVVSLGGELDLVACEEFFEYMQAQIDRGFFKIIINCRSLEFLPSVGIRALIRIRARVRKKGGFVFLARLQPNVGDMLHFLHLDRVFQIYPTVRLAMESLDTESSAAG